MPELPELTEEGELILQLLEEDDSDLLKKIKDHVIAAVETKGYCDNFEGEIDYFNISRSDQNRIVLYHLKQVYPDAYGDYLERAREKIIRHWIEEAFYN